MSYVFSHRELFITPMLKPKPTTLIVGGKVVRGDKTQTPVGVYDAIRKDVRRLSKVEPVEDIALARTKYGWQGVLVSNGTPHLFVMSGDGFEVQEPREELQPKTWQYFRELLDAEHQLSLLAREREADQEIAEFNTRMTVPSSMPAGDLGPGTEKERKFTGPKTKEGKRDPVERVPEAYQEGFTQKIQQRYGVTKALPRKTREDRENEQKKESKPSKASKKTGGTGATGRTRYTYPGEKGGEKKDKPKKEAPKQAPAEEPQDEPQGDESKPTQSPIRVPNTDQGAVQEPPQHSVDLEPLLTQLQTTKELLQRVAERFQSGAKKMKGRSGFILFMTTHLKEFAQKHHLDGDYFGLVYDVLTEAIPEAAPPEAEKAPNTKGSQPPPQ